MRISDWSSDVCSSDLKYRLNFGPDLRTTNGGRFIGSMTNTKQGGSNEASTTKNDTRAYTLENILTLNKRFNEAHALDLTLMQSIQHQTVETSFVAAAGIPAENMRRHDLSAGKNIGLDRQSVVSGKCVSVRVAFGGRCI